MILASANKSNKNSRKLVSRVLLEKEKTGLCAAERRKETIKNGRKRKEKEKNWPSRGTIKWCIRAGVPRRADGVHSRLKSAA